MTLEAGQSLLQYRLIAKIGEGGMGVVWRASDTNLDREVAIKVLPAALADDRERITRFQREAKLLASLNHSNIAAVHGFDSADDVRFLVMEYVEGETLAERLKRGALSPDDALAVARQIAEALEVAHGSGVVHRDLKPGNVMLRSDGTVKVLDFGLAKALPESDTSASESLSPTFPIDVTMPGILLGTAAYMSPEQARGRGVDKRTDIWAFGVILYECLTGDRLFAGDSAHDSMGAILHKEPDWSRLPEETPPTIRLLLRRCLTRPRKRRLHDIADARVEIEAAIDDPTGSSLGLAAQAVTGVEPSASRRSGILGLVAGLVLGALFVGGYAILRTPPVEREAVRRFEFAEELKPRHPVITRSGETIAFSSGGSVYVRDLDSVGNRLLWEMPSDGEVDGLAFSPDGASLAVYGGKTLWRIEMASGQAIELTDKAGAYLAHWSDDGSIWLHGYSDGKSHRVPERGGSAEPVIERVEGELHLHGLSSLPGGRGMLAASHLMDADAIEIVLYAPDGERRVLHREEGDLARPEYVSSGHILYARSTRPKGIWALPFSLDDLEVTGEPFLVQSGAYSRFSVSDAGDLVYSKNVPPEAQRQELVWVNRSGEVESRLGVTMYNAFGLALSGDGTRLALSARGLDERESETATDIWIVDLERALATRLAAEPGYQFDPIWSSGDERIIYASAKSFAEVDVVTRSADGSGAAEVLVEKAIAISMGADGVTAAVVRGTPSSDMWVEVGRLDDPSSWREFQNSDESDFNAIVRPGGGLVAYTTGVFMGGEATLFLRRFPEGDGRWRVSRNSVEEIGWSREGDRLYFVEIVGDERILMEVPVDFDGTRLRLGEATPLFPMGSGRFTGFEVAPDGERFIMLQGPEASEDEGESEEGIVLVENWFEQFREPNGP